jgi:FtsZ-binding cell division protein ZapB
LVAEVERLREENKQLRAAVEYALQMMEALPKATTGQLCDWLIRAQSVLGKK